MAFDEVLTCANAFTMLCWVDFTIEWLARFVGEEENVMESLKQDQFPRLLESTVMEFKFAALYVKE